MPCEPRGLLAPYLRDEFASLGRDGVQVVRALDTADEHRKRILADARALEARVGVVDARLLQTHGAGQWNSTWRARAATMPVWQRLYRTEDVLSSFDGLSIVGPDAMREVYDDTNEHGEPSWLHRDQRCSNERLADTLQGYLALTDAEEDDYSTVFYVPRVHKTAQEMVDAFHTRFYRRTSRAGRQIKSVYDDDAPDYHPFSEEQLVWLRRHCTLLKPRLKKGDLLLWCSAMPHAAVGYPSTHPAKQRVGLFVAMVPGECATAYHRTVRREMARTGLTSSHNVLDGCLFPHSGPSFPAPTYDARVAAVRKRLIG